MREGEEVTRILCTMRLNLVMVAMKVSEGQLP